MRKLLLSFFLLFLSVSIFAQFNFDLGLKGGVNFSKISFDADDYSAESVTKSHFGAFSRIGWGRIFIQPETYYSAKGGDLSSNVIDMAASFDYSTIDIPVLLGIKIIQDKKADLHIIAGPVFSVITSENISSDEMFNKSFYADNYVSIQYGLGIDIWFLTFDARMENGLGDFYTQPSATAKNQTFMLSVGFKIF